MRRIRLSIITLALLAAILLVPLLSANAHAATKSSHPSISKTAHFDPKVQRPAVNNVPCGWFHAVEIYNSEELCFENSGHLSVNIYGVTLISDTGNDGHAETFYCKHQYLYTLTQNTYWSGNCADLTDIYL